MKLRELVLSDRLTLTPQSRRVYLSRLNHLDRFLGNEPSTSDLTLTTWSEFKAWMDSQDYSPKTVRTTRNAVSVHALCVRTVALGGGTRAGALVLVPRGRGRSITNASLGKRYFSASSGLPWEVSVFNSRSSTATTDDGIGE